MGAVLLALTDELVDELVEGEESLRQSDLMAALRWSMTPAIAVRSASAVCST